MVTCITRLVLMRAAAIRLTLHSRPMRRWLTVLLLVLLPLQSSWAAVATYCTHETGAAADHVGHHDHASHAHGGKVADPSDERSTEAPSAPASSLDCGHCHGYSVGLLEVPPSLEPLAHGIAPARLGDAPCAEHVPAQPERPQWAPLA